MKFALITFVVIGHFIEQYSGFLQSDFGYIWIFIYSFHMPLFIYISGMFHKNNKIAQKVFAYIVLGYIYKFIIFVIQNTMGNEEKLYFFYEAGTPWFVFAMAVFVLVTYILRDVDRKSVLIFSIIFACFAGYDNSIKYFFSLSRLIVFYPFYLLGVITNKDKILMLANNKCAKIVAVFTLIFVMFLCIYKYEVIVQLSSLFAGRTPYNEKMYCWGALYRLLFYAIAIVNGGAWICAMPNKKIAMVSEFGKRTIQVYFWHRPILYVLVNLGIVELLCVNWFGKSIYLLISVLLTFILSLRVFSFPTKQILNIKNTDNS